MPAGALELHLASMRAALAAVCCWASCACASALPLAQPELSQLAPAHTSGEISILAVVPARDAAGLGSGISKASVRRQILQDAAAATDAFAWLPPCPALDAHLGPAVPSARSGNFTSHPDFSQIRNCTAVPVTDSDNLRALIQRPLPLLKRMRLTSADGVFKYTAATLPWTNGSVNVIDCRGSWLDLTLLEEPALRPAIVVFLACKLLMPDVISPIASEQWLVGCSIHWPCNVRACQMLLPYRLSQHDVVVTFCAVHASCLMSRSAGHSQPDQRLRRALACAKNKRLGQFRRGHHAGDCSDYTCRGSAHQRQ